MALVVQASAMSLTDLYNLRDQPDRIKETAKSMIKNGSVLSDIKQVTNASLEIRGREFTNVSAPGWHPLNDPLSNFKQTPRDWAEDTYQVGDYLDIAMRILRAEKAEGRSPEALFDEQVDQYLLGLSFDLNTKFFRNAHGGDPATYAVIDANAPVGLITRFRNAAKYRINAECNVNAGGLDMSPSGITAANASSFIRYMQTALYSIGEENGDNCTAWAAEPLLMAIEDGIRRLGAGGGWEMTTDAFGRRLAKYRNMAIHTAGRQAPDSSQVQAQVLSTTENSAGTVDTGSTYTSMVIVKSSEKDFYMTKADELKPTDPYKLENGTHMRVVVQNAYGLVQKNTRCVARVFGVKIS